MMQLNRLRVSLVIPAYNEESHLAACLNAIAAQTVRPFEVIVVDNNSTDQTATIARRYPFVTLLQESRQGVVYARNRGFDAARGDIIGRTDADGILAEDWVAQVQTVFSDPAVAAASGVVGYRDVALKQVFDGTDALIRRYLANRTGRVHETFLYGVNMAIRRQAWLGVRQSVCHERRMHEDIDLAVHLSQASHHVVFAAAMQATISPRQANSPPRAFHTYVWSSPRVYATHNMISQRYMYPVAFCVSALYVPIRLLYQGYDPATQRFSLRQALRGKPLVRVSPISEVA
jgi:glycosyltransferase involved in cell wall biosynthesis